MVVVARLGGRVGRGAEAWTAWDHRVLVLARLADYTVGHVVDILAYGVPGDPYNQHITEHFNDWQNRLGFGVINSGAADGVSVSHVAPSTTLRAAIVSIHPGATASGMRASSSAPAWRKLTSQAASEGVGHVIDLAATPGMCRNCA